MEIKTFRHANKMFNYYPVNLDITSNDIPYIHQYKESGYNYEGMAFDIETTSYIANDGSHKATMYCWQFAIGSSTYFGRTWEEFEIFLDLLADKTEKSDLLCIVWVQNLSFEFQFIKARLKWNVNKKTGAPDIFAKSDRSILYAKYRNIEFRDSLAITDIGLAKYKKNYKLNLDKLTGDLDYTLLRGSNTPLTNSEIAYCINDVQILVEWHQKYIIPEFIAKEKSIPLTSTGIVRQEMKELFNKEDSDFRKKYRRTIRTAQPSREIYEIMRLYLFRGGLTHANTALCNILINYEKAASYDLKSAHPSSMLREKFPYKFYRVNTNKFERVWKESASGDYGFFGIFEFYNIHSSGWHCLESKNKLIDYSGDSSFENGRLAKSSYIKVALTEIDYENYLRMYSWESMKCNCLYQAQKKPLPDFLRKMVFKYFEIKETIDKNDFNYILTKRKLNGLFGMCATGIVEDELIFNPETNEFEAGYTNDYYQLTKNLLLLPQWAVWIAGYTRRDIVNLLAITGCDSVYYDTDSDKILNYEKWESEIIKFNEERRKQNLSMETYDFNPKLFEKIGCFEREYITDKMKVMGAKRYIVEYTNDRGEVETHVTVAGMVKGSLEKYCKINGLDIWETFTNGLLLSPEFSMKKTTTYCDLEFEDSFIDYKGILQSFKEKSCVAIYSIPFEMNVEKEFLQRILEKSAERENHIYKGGF